MQHPDKILIGRTERGFDFLGYHFEPEGLSVADQTIERFKERIARLYEQGADINRIGQYVLRWLQWSRAGIPELLKVSSCRSNIDQINPRYG
jgi:RNA-directed DNA polymerase